MTPDELRLVARTLSAVGHELSGPVQTAMNAAFVLERGAKTAVGDASLARLTDALSALRVRLERLQALPSALRVQRAPVALDAVVRDTLAGLGPDASRVELTLRSEGEPSVDGAAAAEALHELLRNALTAAPPGTPVALAAAADARRLVFTVENPGAWSGDPQAALSPFVTSRPASFGLGLPIARAVALAHGGDLSLASAAGRATAILELPGGPA